MYLPGTVGLVIFLSDVPPCCINLASCGHSHCEEIMFCSHVVSYFFLWMSTLSSLKQCLSGWCISVKKREVRVVRNKHILRVQLLKLQHPL
jgi:hypothetical protein